jgi:pyrimidine-nucleoside phosphorylase/thymidine phosphorylase
MVVLAGLAGDDRTASARVAHALESGRALETFARMIERQGGNPRVTENYALLPSAPARVICSASHSGYLTALKAEAIGKASNVLGAGRSTVGEAIDHGVGVVVLAKPGDRVTRGQPLVELHHRGRGVEDALEFCRAAIAIDDEPPPRREKVLGEVR